MEKTRGASRAKACARSRCRSLSPSLSLSPRLPLPRAREAGLLGAGSERLGAPVGGKARGRRAAAPPSRSDADGPQTNFLSISTLCPLVLFGAMFISN